MASETNRRGCGCGCLPVLLGLPLILLALLLAWPLAMEQGILERVGLRVPAVEERLSGTPDREAASALRDELMQGGMDPTGMVIAVFPFLGRDDSLAVLLLDASQGFTFTGMETDDVIIETFVRVAAGPVAQGYDFSRVAIHYVDDQGEPQLSVTAASSAIRDYGHGMLTREELMEAIDTKFELADIFGDFSVGMGE